jgi:TRAP-type C4-dicarboxylate transport system substrate-binding protein
MVSKKSWDALPKDLQAVVSSAVQIYSDELEQLTWKDNMEMERKLKKLGSTPIYWSQADLDKLKEAGMSLLPEIAAKGPRVAKGIKIIEDYLAELKAAQPK